MGHQQMVYTSLPGSGYSQRQLVFENQRFQGTAALSPAVLSSTYSAVRDRLFTWAVNACLLRAGKQQGLGLMALPGEALLQIVASLPYGDVAVTASVCKRLSAAAADDSVWKQVYTEEFKKEFPGGEVRFLFTAVEEPRRIRQQCRLVVGCSPHLMMVPHLALYELHVYTSIYDITNGHPHQS